MIVAKFGGTSLATAEQIKKVCKIIMSDSRRRLVVVSAPGKRNKNDIKVTDLLIACAEKFLADGSAEAELKAVIERYSDIACQLGLGSDIIELISDDLNSRLKASVDNRYRFIDSMKAAGEDNTAKLVAAYLCSTGVKARYINPGEAGLLLSNQFGNAHVLPESYENLRKLRDNEEIMIFPGFFGYTPEGCVATFPRGGSDITGAILAAAVDAELYENFTDVDSVFAANPNVIENPKAITELTYREMRELSYAGFSVLHEETLSPVYHAGIPVCIKNTNNPSCKGTMILPQRKYVPNQVIGIACDTGFCSINISKYLMNREIGFGRRLLQILEEEGLSYEHTPSGIDNISVILRESYLDQDTEERVVSRIKKELMLSDVNVQHGMAIVIIVGEGMQNSIGIAARATGALARSSVNVEMINQGASEISMMFGIRGTDSEKAVRALYAEFFAD